MNRRNVIAILLLVIVCESVWCLPGFTQRHVFYWNEPRLTGHSEAIARMLRDSREELAFSEGIRLISLPDQEVSPFEKQDIAALLLERKAWRPDSCFTSPDTVQQIRKAIEGTESNPNDFSHFITGESLTFSPAYTLAVGELWLTLGESRWRQGDRSQALELIRGWNVLIPILLKPNLETEDRWCDILVFCSKVCERQARYLPDSDPHRNELLQRSNQILTDCDSLPVPLRNRCYLTQLENMRWHLPPEQSLDQINEFFKSNEIMTDDFRLGLTTLMIRVLFDANRQDEAMKLAESKKDPQGNPLPDRNSLRRDSRFLYDDWLLARLEIWLGISSRLPLSEQRSKSNIDSARMKQAQEIWSEIRTLGESAIRQRAGDLFLQSVPEQGNSDSVQAAAKIAWQRNDIKEAIRLYDLAAQNAKSESEAFQMRATAAAILEKSLAGNEQDIERRKELMSRLMNAATDSPGETNASALFQNGLSIAASLLRRNEISFDDYIKYRMQYQKLFARLDGSDDFRLQTVILLLRNRQEEVALSLLAERSGGQAIPDLLFREIMKAMEKTLNNREQRKDESTLKRFADIALKLMAEQKKEPSPDALLVQARAFDLTGQTQAAIDLLARLRKDSPNDPRILFAIAEILSRRQDTKSLRLAIDYWTLAADDLSPGSPDWWFAREKVLVILQRLNDRPQFDKLLAILTLTEPELGGPQQRERIEKIRSLFPVSKDD